MGVYQTFLYMVCERFVVCGLIAVGQSPFSDSANHPSEVGISGESMSYSAA